MSDNNINGPEDAIVSEMIKILLMEKTYTLTMCFQARLLGLMEISRFVEDRDSLLEESGPLKKGIRSCRAVALTSVMSKWYATCTLLRLEKEKQSEKWKNLHVGGVDGISCQHLQVMVTNLPQKHWERQEERNPVMRHGTVVRLTMYLASLDIKTAFDEAKPKHVAEIMDNHNTHGWLIAALLREMSGLSGKATFECMESGFAFNRFLRQGSV